MEIERRISLISNSFFIIFSFEYIRYHVTSKEAHHWTTMWRLMNEIGFEVKCILKSFFCYLLPFSFPLSFPNLIWLGQDIVDEQLFLDTASKPKSPLKRILGFLEIMRSQWYYTKRPVDDPVLKNGLPVSKTSTTYIWYRFPKLKAKF